ncbi:MAG: amino acid adenylation domain-containing protein [Fluviicola sp.]
MQLIKELRELGITIDVVEGNLDLKMPKGVITPELLEKIKSNKAEIIRFIESYKGKLQVNTSIQPLGYQEDYAVSLAQKRLWILSQNEQASVAYNMVIPYVIRGELNVSTLQKAFEFLVNRHEILRTTFFMNDAGEIRQKIHPSELSVLEVIDLKKEVDIKSQIQSLVTSNISLEQGPLFQVKLFPDLQGYTMVLVMHHIISDGWSIGVMVDELVKAYLAFNSGLDVPLNPLQIQYKDFAVWQKEQLTEGKVEPHKNYWLKMFLGDLPVLDLQTDRIRPSMKTYNGSKHSHTFNSSISNEINDYARKKGITLFSFLLSAVNVLLYKLTQQKDIILGSPMAGRMHDELENQLGFYVNTVAIRTKIDENNGFETLLNGMKDMLLEVHEHQIYPFDELLDLLSLQKDLSRSPLFDVMVVLQNAISQNQSDDSNQVLFKTYDDLEHAASKYDLTFVFNEHGDKLHLQVEYNSDLYFEKTVIKYVGLLEVLFNKLLNNPSQPLSQINLLDQTETERILFKYNTQNIGYPEDLTIVQIFEKQVELYPDATAVKYGENVFTYSELNEKSNQLGRYLIEKYAVEEEDLIGLLLGRNTDMLVSILAVLKIRAAYVPIDPTYPESRIEYIRNDSKSKALVTDEVLANFEEIRSAYSVENLDIQIQPQNLAYVIYTSGTTGLPKGTLIEHKNVVRLFFNDEAKFDFSEKDVWTLFHSYCFDFSVWEMYGALLFGGKLIVVDHQTAKDPARFLALMREEGVSVLNQTPSSFYNVIKEEVKNTDSNLSLRYVVFGGEALAPARLKDWYLRYPETKLVNMYGITETTVHVTYKEIGAEEIESNISNIGKAIPTTHCYVLDENLNILPTGLVGELYVGGEGVARGYLNRDELTQERFIQAPFLPKSRIYKSGDKVRFLENGEMEYLGRLDDQVKIRGHRIELVEIEAFIQKFEGVNEVIVLAKKDESAVQFLVAYITSDDQLTINQLRNFLRKQVPEYMIPAYFVQLDHFPLTANGKINKKELPDPRTESMSTGVEYVAPNTIVQKEIASIFHEIFGDKKIGINDNFFAIGGDSIKAIKFSTISKNKYGKKISVNDLFQHHTIAELEEFLRSGDQVDTTAIELENGWQHIEQVKQSILDENKFVEKITDAYEAIYPLTAIEKGMIFSSLMRPKEPIYYDQFNYSIRFSSEENFVESMQKLCDRHAILRTKYFLNSFNQPVKVTLERCHVPMSMEDISHLNKAEQEEVFMAYSKQDLNERSSFDDVLLWHLKVFKVTQDEYFIFLSFHHSMLDGWSTSVMITELALFMEGESLPVLPHTYADYCAIMLGREKSSRVEDFWVNKMRGYSRNKLPFNYKRSKVSNEQGMHRIDRAIGSDLLVKLERLAVEKQVSFKAICLAAHVYLMHVICSEKDVVTGFVTHDRPELEDSDKILGCFLNTIPIRVNIDALESIEQLIVFVSDYLNEVKPNEVHLSEIVKFTNEKTSSDNPIFDTILNYTDFHSYDEMKDTNSIENGEVEYKDEVRISSEMTNTKFDFEVDKTLGRFSIRIKYLPAYFYDSEIRTALELYVRILEQFVTGVDKKLDTSVLVSEEDLNYILNEFNNTTEPYSKTKTIHALFEEAVVAYPENIALRQHGAVMTYKELNSRSNQIARNLIEMGVEPGDNVGIIAKRSFDMIVGLMGILKSGGAYVPVDPEYPQERQSYILSNSDVKLVVVDAYYEVVDAYDAETILSIDGITWETETIANPEVSIPTNQLAYTIYTSGSTGRPKGVMIEHHSAVNLIEWVNKTYHVGEEDRLLFITSMCFDLSVYDIFGTLATGGSLVIANQQEVQNVRILKQLLLDEKITFWDSVPTTMNYLIGELEVDGDQFSQSDLRLVFMSGDWIPVQLPGRIHKFFPNTQNISLGGATEGTVWSNSFPIPKVLETWTSIPYGQPIANNLFYILDENKKMVPKGVAGELYIGGVGVARGYANDEVKTTHSFVKDPFIQKLGGFMYRTGDLGRLLPDGNMEFLGRVDHQVKIRGYRVELGEIESILQKHPAISEAVVNNFNDTHGNTQLCAYLVSPETMKQNEIIAYLKEHLPSYMIPNHFMQLETLPLTSNGKVNRKALPEPRYQETSGTEYVAPETELEQIVTDTIASILSMDRVGMFDDFFEIGANSLQVGALVNRLHKETNILLDIRDIFEAPTCSGIVAVLQSKKENEYVQIPRVKLMDDYPVSYSQQRMWILSQLEGGSRAYHMPNSMRLKGNLDVKKFVRAIDLVIDKHEILRTIFNSNENGDLRQKIVSREELKFNLDVRDISTLVNQEAFVKAYVKENTETLFDLSKGPLLRVGILQLNEAEFIFYYNMHHIISDGWSMEVITKDVLSIYNALLNDEKVETTLPIQYKDYASWQISQVENKEISESRNYWLAQLSGEIPVLDLPTQKPRPTFKTYSGEIVDFSFTKEVTDQLNSYCLNEGGTLFMGLLAGLYGLLSRYTNQEDIIVGTPIAGRTSIELENQIGLYLNTLALRTQFSMEDSFSALFAKVKETTLNAYDHQLYPFDKLVKDLNVVNDSSRNPLFDVMLVLQNISQEERNTDDFVEAIGEGYRDLISHFDITFTFSEQNGVLYGSAEYNTDIYSRNFVDQLTKHYQRFLEECLKTKTVSISDVSFIDQVERHKLLFEFNYNEANVDYRLNTTLVDLFEDQAKRNPDNVAVVFENQEITYKILNEEANQLGSYLRKTYSIQPDDLIGIKLDRSPEMIISVLGILKSGAAYVPIDPSYPEERINYIEEDSRAKVVLDRQEFGHFHRVKEEFSKNNPEKINTSSDLAYIIYTSGTVGTPKGVMVQHSNAVSISECWKKQYKLSEIPVVLLQLASISFDVFVGDFCRSLLNGGKMIICPNEVKSQPESFYKVISDNEVSILEGTPALLLTLCNYIFENGLSLESLRMLIFGSDSIKNQDYVSIKKAIGNHVKVINSYGVTEATIDSTFYEGLNEEHLGITPIGKPFANSNIYILDEDQKLLPVGVFGKIFIGGDGVTRGYLNNKELTSEKFISNPFIEGETLFETGDVARWLEDGNIEFLGRKDSQVKIRGYRVELGEIESVISTYSEELQQVIVEAKDINQSKALVAYYVSKTPLEKSNIRTYLQQNLPEYMVPGYFINLKEVPLTPNGKIDRKALPDVTEDDLIRREFVEPRNETEETLVTIWQEVLGVESIGVKDNFFELGGDSIKLIRLMNLMSKRITDKIRLENFYGEPTIEFSALYIRAMLTTETEENDEVFYL